MIIRDAASSDAAAIADLAAEIGFAMPVERVAERFRLLDDAGETPLVAEQVGSVLACLTWHVTPVLHRLTPVGRITMLVVTSRFRSRGIGRALVEAAEARLLERGCSLVEVTSNLRLIDAHRFYERLGYEQTSLRFAKQVCA